MTSTVDAAPVAPPPFVPRIGPLTAARRSWWIVLLFVLIFTAAGVAAAMRRPPIYSAEARLAVGRIDVSAPGALGSFTVATQALAAQYSRSIDGLGVTRRVAPEVGLTPLQVAARVGATPIPESPVIRVFGTGLSERSAVRLANAASNALVAFTTDLNRANPDSPRLLREFRDASRAVLTLEQRVTLHRKEHLATPSDKTRATLQQAQVNLEVAQLRKQTAQVAYDASTRSQSSTALVQVLQPAALATSDFVRYVQLFGFAGFAAGLAIGLAIATWRENRRERRRFGV
jgi:hypothetical protein